MVSLGFVKVRQLLLALAGCHEERDILDLAVKSIATSSSIALVRVWLIDDGDICPSCTDACIDVDGRRRCLHLKASAGQSAVDGRQWDYTAGSSFSRFPLGVRKVGQIAASGKPVETNISSDAEWLADPEWIARERILSFAGQPLVFRDEVLGVLSVFFRTPLQLGNLEMLRLVADHLAYSLTNVRTMETVHRLKQQLELENAYLREEIDKTRTGIVGCCEVIEGVRRNIDLVAATDANVLIYGESGTGKEVVAQEIHDRSSRCKGPMIKINCAAIPQELFESEFFGYVRGAFTGALKNRIGHFQAADGGTLFLDEVAEIPVFLQSKLLRVLQEGEYQRIGEDRTHKVDVRVISATNKQLYGEILKGTFREDLFYRLNVFPIEMPPLRERKQDIPLLADVFIREIATKMNRVPLILSDDQIRNLMAYDWPGNIRELRNIIERMMITGRPNQVLREIVPAVRGSSARGGRKSSEEVETRVAPEAAGMVRRGVLTESALRELERANMEEALRMTNWKIYGPRGAARLLDVNPTTLISRLKKFGITRPSADCAVDQPR
ncbi:MAG: sigma 54-interacting transcriptional regulator [Desulfovibrio sp.]|jgi:transcriptional regulator with GAF, ATPase, and Fis domain|nr:sigma 54-interacting transcriptional regulator [Desulfovibrio sp.]